MSERPTWDEYSVQITRQAAMRSTCRRLQVGASTVRAKRILSAGSNGAPGRFAHCRDTGCLREEWKIPLRERQEICRGLHAEQNAIIQAALHGVSVADADIHVTHQPCITCAKMIINAGLQLVVCLDSFPTNARLAFSNRQVSTSRVGANTQATAGYTIGCQTMPGTRDMSEQ